MTVLPPGGDSERVRPSWTWREREAATRSRGVYLDPTLQPPGGPEVFSTVYEPDVLLLSPTTEGESPGVGEELAAAAARLGWRVTELPLEEAVSPRPGGRPDEVSDSARRADLTAEQVPTAARTLRTRITVSPDADPAKPVLRPDAWQLLAEARRSGVTGVTLNHVLSVDSGGVNPFKGNPFKGNPFKGNPFKGNPFTGSAGGMESYAYPGFGGRQPVVFTGPAPRRDPALATADRPVVAVLDTGCGRHPWFAGDVLVDAAAELGGTIGDVDPASDPEVHPSQGDPLDGVIDDAAGHGTFIAGIILQACPDARILAVRVSDGQGTILESRLIAALGQLVTLIEAGTRIDVINLSFGFYHESQDSAAIDGELYPLLTRARARGTVVVCSAGNDATDRPSSPASLYAWDGPDAVIGHDVEKGLAPQVVVGALNPSGRSVALFSNVGDWVGTYALGVSVLSTTPAFEGGVQADLRRDEYARRRETLDLDDFRSGFAVWSGTSFAAPLVAGRIAAAIGEVPTSAHLLASTGELATTVESVIAASDVEDHSHTI